MKDYQTEVITEPVKGTATVLIFNKIGPYTIIEGTCAINYLCGACRNIICKNVERSQVINLVLQCPKCRNYNRIRGT